jgi:two-component SAPR family response regulator
MEAADRSSGDPGVLGGLSILIVEDDYFVASDCASILRTHGARVLGPVPDMARGRALLEQESPDCALLDVNLKGEFVFELAEELIERGVPAIFITGYDRSFLPASLRDAPCLVKPVESRDLVRVVKESSTRH